MKKISPIIVLKIELIYLVIIDKNQNVDKNVLINNNLNFYKNIILKIYD